MFDLKGELKKQIIEEIQLDSLIQKHFDKLDEKHMNDVKKDVKKEIVNVIQE